MAPYTHSNNTLVLSEKTIPLTQYNRLTRRSLETSIFTPASPQAARAEIANTYLAADIPNRGVGPLILQPSPSSAADAYANERDSSARLAFIAILAIPLLGGFVVFLIIRRRRKQKPARRSVPSPLNLRSEAARARVDVESPRIQQLPRDRIRAMNSVTRDNEAPGSPRAEYQIFSPRVPSPSPDKHTHPLGNYFAPLSIPGSSEPSTPLLNSPTSTANLVSCPPTPCTPTFPMSPIPTCHVESVSGTDQNDEGTRFTWDFRCKGMANRRTVSIESVLDICHANTIVASSVGKTRPDAESTVPSSSDWEPAITQTDDLAKDGENPFLDADSSEDEPLPSASACCDDKGLSVVSPGDNEGIFSSTAQSGSATLEPGSSEIQEESISAVVASPAEVESSKVQAECEDSGPKTPSKSESHFSASLTVLDLKLDVATFSSQIIKALSDSPDCSLVEDCDRDEFPAPNEDSLETPVKASKKRLILSKPNHRTLTPTSPSLKVHTLCVDATLIADLDLHVTTHPQTPKGRKRASSDTRVEVVRRSRLLSGLASGKSSDRIPLIENASGKALANTKLDDTRLWAESVLLRSSLSMPVRLSVQLACPSPSPTMVDVKQD